MKLNTIKQLILRFIGGGKIQIPTRFLKSVDIESPDMKSDITANDITPELFENNDVYKKICNWGLTDEELRNLPVIYGMNEDNVGEIFEYNEDIEFQGRNFTINIVKPINNGVQYIKFYHESGNDNQEHLQELFDFIKDSNYLLYYSWNIENGEEENINYEIITVLKRVRGNNNVILFASYNKSLQIEFDSNTLPLIYIGVDNF